MLAQRQPKILVRCCLETRRRMARERRRARSSLVSMETPITNNILRCVIGSREKEYQDKKTEVQDNRLHRNAFTHKSFYTQTLLHRCTFTHRSFYTQTLLHRSFYTQTLLHRCTFTHKHFLHTNIFTQKHSYTQTRLHTSTFTQKLLHTDASLHTESFIHRHFYTHTLAQKYFIELLMWNASNVHKQSNKVWQEKLGWSIVKFSSRYAFYVLALK